MFGDEQLMLLTLLSQLTWLSLMALTAASKVAIFGKHMLRGNISSLLGS